MGKTLDEVLTAMPAARQRRIRARASEMVAETTALHEDAEWFRATLKRLGHTQTSFGRWMGELGDTRPEDTIARSIRRMATGEAKVPGEMRVLLHLLVKQEFG